MLLTSAVLSLLCAQPTGGDQNAPRGLTIVLADIGQGSSIVLRTPDGVVHVFDGGPNGAGSQRLIPLIRSLAPVSYGATFLSHYDLDHSGGLDEVLSGLPFGIAYDRGDVRASGSGYSAYTAVAGSRRRQPQVGQVLQLGGGVTATVLAMNGLVIGNTQVAVTGGYQEENARSMAVRVDYRDFSIFIGGDLTGGGSGTPDVETLTAQRCGDIDVYVADHHGSSTSTNSRMWGFLAADCALVSCGTDNSYGHPHIETINLINQAARSVPFISTTVGARKQGYAVAGGDITVVTDGLRYRVTNPAGEFFDFYVDEAAPPVPASGEVVVSELLWDPNAVADSFGEYVELTNVSGRPLSLRGARLSTTNGTVTIGGNLALFPGRPLVTGNDGDPGRNGGQPMGWVWPYASLALSNSGNTVRLQHGAAEIDSVTYGAGFPGGRGVAAERRDLLGGASAANHAAAMIQFGLGDRGSPGRRNDADATAAPALLLVEPATDHLLLRASALADGGRTSVVAFAFGSSPGFPLFGTQVPLNIDPLMELGLGFPGVIAPLPPEGYRSIAVPLPVPNPATGIPAVAAHLVLDLLQPRVAAVSLPAGFVFP